MLKNIVLFALLFLVLQGHAQIPFPLTFRWKGAINNRTEYEVLVKMVDSYEALNGKKSRLSGYCTFPETWTRLRMEGTSEKGHIVMNLFDGDKMVQSFLFAKTDKRQKRQTGDWTNGKIEQQVWFESEDPLSISKPHILGFCIGVNDRISRLQADSIAAPILKKIPAAPFLQVGEGYRLEDKTFLEADYYGVTYLEFADTITLPDSIENIHQLSWQLLHSEQARPFILEIRSLRQNNNLEKLQLSVWQYVGKAWIPVHNDIFPSGFIENKSLVLPEGLTDFLATDNRLVFFVKNGENPVVLKWTGDKFE